MSNICSEALSSVRKASTRSSCASRTSAAQFPAFLDFQPLGTFGLSPRVYGEPNTRPQLPRAHPNTRAHKTTVPCLPQHTTNARCGIKPWNTPAVYFRAGSWLGLAFWCFVEDDDDLISLLSLPGRGGVTLHWRARGRARVCVHTFPCPGEAAQTTSASWEALQKEERLLVSPPKNGF